MDMPKEIEFTIRFNNTELLSLLFNGRESYFPIDTDKYYLCLWSRPDHEDFGTIAYLWIDAEMGMI